MKYLFLTLFIVATGMHLYASKTLNQKLRNITKPFILLLLLGFYVSSAEKVLTPMILALLFSWLGDVLLIGKGVKWFAAGGVSFMAGHVCFIISYNTQIGFSNLNIAEILIPAVIYASAVVFVFTKLKPYLLKVLFYPMFCYLLTNGSMNCFALFRLLSHPCQATVITFVGALLFFVSDCCLFFVRFKKDGLQKTHFVVMLTYSVGELLIVLGML